MERPRTAKEKFEFAEINKEVNYKQRADMRKSTTETIYTNVSEG